MCPKQKNGPQSTPHHRATLHTPVQEILAYLRMRFEEAEEVIAWACMREDEGDELQEAQEQFDDLDTCICGEDHGEESDDEDLATDEEEQEDEERQSQIEFILEHRDKARLLSQLIVEVEQGTYQNAVAWFRKEANLSWATNEAIQKHRKLPFWMQHQAFAQCDTIERLTSQLEALTKSLSQ